MQEERTQCLATTQAGTQCRNKAQLGSNYCHLHRLQAAPGQEGAASARSSLGTGHAIQSQQADMPVSRAEFNMLVTELNALTAELQRRVPSPLAVERPADNLYDLLKQSWDRFAPEVQFEILQELKGNLEGTTPQDLVDPATWKGLGYILYYMAQTRVTAARAAFAQFIGTLPGGSFCLDLWGNLAGTPPREFLDPETWKGLVLVIGYTVQGSANDLWRRVVEEEPAPGPASMPEETSTAGVEGGEVAEADDITSQAARGDMPAVDADMSDTKQPE